ncbi:MAG: shikimate dehydrogenase, partial [Candidatus Poribacteria bacterium]|nr:shikimate dehydrogenase [Candidatus Poribacteria bacterium]
LRPQTAVYDIVYTPPETRLLSVAAERGCHTIQGLSMLVYQGAIAFEKWTHVTPPVKTMKDALQQALY